MKKKGIALLLMSILLGSSIAGCGSKASSSTVGSSSGEGEAFAGTIKVGALDPTTGDNAQLGTDDLNGKTMAVDDFNDAGGATIDGKKYKIELVSYDDASQASQSVQAATKLITQDKVVAIAGSFTSSCTLADLDVLNEYKIPMVTSGSSADTVLTSGCNWISRSFSGDKLQISALLNYIEDSGTKVSKIGVIYENDDYGIGGFNGVQEAAAKKNIDVVGEAFGVDDTDMTAQLASLRDQGVDALFIWANYTPGSYVMKQARALNWDVQFYSGTGTIHPNTFELSDNTYVGTINSVPFTTTTTDEDTQKWIKRYSEKYNAEPSQNVARGYDGMMVILDAINTAGSTDSEEIQNAIRNTKDHKGVQGTFSINPDSGEYEGEVQIVQAADGGTWKYLSSASTTE